LCRAFNRDNLSRGHSNTAETAFNQVISDSAGDSFNGATVQEGNAAPGQDTCWFSTSIGPRVTGVPTNPPSSWTVAGGQVVGQPNHWGFDVVGWSTQAVSYYRTQAPAHGIAGSQPLGQLRAFAISDHPAGDVPAEDIEDYVEVEISPFGGPG